MIVETKAVPNDQLHYGANGVDRLYARAWGDSIHFGLYPDEAMDLEAAVFETKRRMALAGGLAAGERILEVASGWGATARYLVRAHGVRVTATNIEDDHLDAARRLTKMQDLTAWIDHAYADFHNLPFEDERYDVWWCQEATVHATEKPCVLAEAWRVLKPGGRVVFSDQTTDRSRCAPDDLARIAARHGSHDLYDVSDFVIALCDAGFADVEARDWSPHMGTHFAKLAERIERNYDGLTAEISAETVDFNLSLWRLGADLARRGGIGWYCFTGRKA